MTEEALNMRTGTVNYHVHKPHRQAFELDAGGITGNLISPELAPTLVEVRDDRASAEPVRFDTDSVEFARSPSSVSDFETPGWEEVYENELTALLTDRLGVREVLIFDHTVRTDDPEANRKPARNVHSDYSEAGARQRLDDLLGSERAAEWAEGHFAFINIWRPVGHPINSAPLGFVRPASVAPDDWILLDLIYPDRKGQIMGLVANQDHEWVYRSEMRPDEVAFFNIYDNRGLPSVAHSALDMVENPAVTTVRQSIESRTLVRY
ncbi:CmcJ/NvfI family oxidoreductase [Roseobacter sp. S98]|uniref:CmcJ/NvfI family oxidoreductase n=1 Tax=Roseobacter algicola (ex Choi et al. 2025) (nom. illeg.) TaxID=3092138 RepID=UPI0035C77A74